jgi:GNAT superfamily N-acetyltransferase
MTLEDIPDGLRLCRLARWNQLEADWRQMLSLSPQGGRVAMVQGKIVGSVVTLNYASRFGWIGMLLVDPAARGLGIGSELFRCSLEVFPGLDPIRLDATPQGRPVYQRFGFVDEYELTRMQREGHLLVEMPGSDGLQRMPEKVPPEVLQWDLEVFGADRSGVLAWARSSAPEYAWIWQREGSLEGYCFGRHGHNFEHAGPIVARSLEAAQQLLAACLRQCPDKPFILDTPTRNLEWRDWLFQLGFVDQRPFTRMFKGENRYPGNPGQLWAILGPEFA